MPPKSDGPGGGVPLSLPDSQRIITARKKMGGESDDEIFMFS